MQASDMKITDRKAGDVYHYMHSIHKLVIVLLRLKVSLKLIEDYTTVPALAVLKGAQDRNAVMDKIQWRSIGKVAAKFVKMRNLKTASIQNKCTWEPVFDGTTTIYAEKCTKANAPKINYKLESGRIHMPSVWDSQGSSCLSLRTLHLEP